MNLIRIAAIALLVWVIYRLIRLAMDRKSDSVSGQTVPLVSCEHCKTRVPEDTAIKKSGKYYCSEEHQRLHQAH